MNTGCVSGQREELAWCPAVLLTADLAGDGGSSDGMDPKAVLNGAMPGGSSSATPVPHVPCWAMLLLSVCQLLEQQPKEQAVIVGTGIC